MTKDSFQLKIVFTSDSSILQVTEAVVSYGVELYQPIENTSIQWNRMRKIEEFNEAQCLNHFRFRKEDLKKMVHVLFLSLPMYLKKNDDNHIVKCQYDFGTCFLVFLRRFFRPRRT